MGHNNDIPPCNIWVDKEGIWYYRGAEMFRKDVVNLFYQNLRKDDSGRYIIEMANDRCYIEVEDTPYVVKAIYKTNKAETGDESIDILLNNADLDRLDPTTLSIGKDNVLYCRVKDKSFDARFSRAGYYQIAEFIEYDKGKDLYYIYLNNNYYYISNSGLRNYED